MSFENSDTDQLSIKEIDEKIEQTRELYSKIYSARETGVVLFGIFLGLALGSFVAYFFPQRYRPVTDVGVLKSPLWFVLLISILLMIPFMRLWVVKNVDGRELVDGGGFAHFWFFTALIAECCGIYFGNHGFALCACWSILLAAIVLKVRADWSGTFEDLFNVSLFWVALGVSVYVFGNYIFRFFGHVHDKNPECCLFIFLGYVIAAFGVTILAMYRFYTACDEETDRLWESIREYEKKKEERQEEELSDEEKLKRAIDRFRV